jgi:putative ABC transport system permease protein
MPPPATRCAPSLSVLAMSIGVAAVVILTALGDGARRYVVGQFSSIGTNLSSSCPGAPAPAASIPANAITTTPRDLTIDDAAALRRACRCSRVAPLAVGTSEISFGGRLREVMVAGSTADFIPDPQFRTGQGQFPAGGRLEPRLVGGGHRRHDPRGNVRQRTAVGQLIRVGDRRLRVVGVLKPVGQGLGMNTDELVIVPVALAQAMFNTNTLFRILVEAKSREAIPGPRNRRWKSLKQRHRGEEDVTVITQDAVLATFDKLLGALTLASPASPRSAWRSPASW